MSDLAADNWIAVASADHVNIGRAGGFMQVNHGKLAPLRRVRPGSRIVYYSPTMQYGAKGKDKDRLQAFTALGIVRDRDPYQVEMDRCFHPYRRDVDWLVTQEAPIKPLLDRLEFARGVANWGQKFRFGLFAVSAHDMAVIADAMSGRLP
jgi:hypothetical protein